MASTTRKFGRSLPRELNPPRPHYLVGREEEKRAVIACLLQHKPAIIYGSVGLGKTWLARAILDDITLRNLSRYFIDCRNIQTLDSLYDKVARALGFRGDKDTPPQELWGAIVQELKSVEAVLCLDDLETLWDQDELREDIGQMLATLTSLSTVALLVTMRTGCPPPYVNWATLNSLPVLSRKDAFQLFQTHSKCADNDEYAWKLVDSTDYLPLPIELLGYLVRYEETTWEVWDRWSKKGTSMVTRGGGPRLDLNCSIELSLNSPQVKKFPTAHSTLCILSLLPVGLDPCSRYFTALQDGMKDLEGNLQCLVHQALVVVDNPTMGRYRLLDPIARYVADNISSPHDRAYLIQSSIDFITSHDPYIPENHLFVPSDLSNIYYVLKCASIEYVDDILAKGIIGFAHWVLFNRSLGDNMLGSVINSTQCSIPLLAEAGRLQGCISTGHSRLDEAEESLDKSLLLYRQVQDVLGEGDALKSLGDLYIRQDRLDEAEESLDTALRLYQQGNSLIREGDTHQSLGQLYLRQNQLLKAQASFKHSIHLSQRCHSRYSDAYSHKWLGKVCEQLHELDEAETHYGIAIDLHCQSSDKSAQAHETTLLLEQLHAKRSIQESGSEGIPHLQ